MKSYFFFFSMCLIGSNIFSFNTYAQWIQSNGPGSPAIHLAVNGTNLYAGTNTQRGTGGVFISSITNPTNWSSINSGLVDLNISALGIHNSVLFAGTRPGPAYRYVGGTWVPLAMGNDQEVLSFASQDTRLFAGTSIRGVYRSDDDGINWIQVNTGLQEFPSIQCFAINGNSLFAGTRDSGIYRSTNYGSNWVHVSNGIPNGNIYALAVIDTILLASVPGDVSFMVYRSTNYGTNWDLVKSQQLPAIDQFAVSGTSIFGSVFGVGVFISTDLGTTWIPVNDGFPQSLPIKSIAVGGDNLFAGASYTATTNGLVYYRPLSEMITDVQEASGSPTEFQLEQNYPNPFNPSTTISFSLPFKSFVSLIVYDALGREVSVLLADELPAGTYSQQWNPEGLSTGVYFYRMQAGSFAETKKLILLR